MPGGGFDKNISRPTVGCIVCSCFVPLEVQGHTIFRTVEFRPGNPHDLHITKSVDIAIVMSGEIRLEPEDGFELTMKTGDRLVRQANIHGRKNIGTGPCLVAFVLMSTEG